MINLTYSERREERKKSKVIMQMAPTKRQNELRRVSASGEKKDLSQHSHWMDCHIDARTVGTTVNETWYTAYRQSVILQSFVEIPFLRRFYTRQLNRKNERQLKGSV